MKTTLLPNHWKNFVILNDLLGAEIEFPWPNENDLEAVIEILSYENVEREANELYPGLIVKKDGFIPVAGCSIGTGNQYCINLKDDENGPLYLVDHTQVLDKNYDQEKAITIMLKHYQDLLDYL